MALTDGLQPATNMFKGGFANLASNAWYLIPIVIIISVIGIVFLIKKMKSKKAQWTHKFKVRRVLPGGRLTDPIIHLARRFPLVKNAEIFELEKPLLGGFLIPEPSKYSGVNEYSIILDENNRIYINEGEFFQPDSNDINVSARHAEIDLGFSNLKADFQNINKVNKRLEWATIAKYAFLIIVLIVGMILGLKGLEEWGKSQSARADSDMAQAEAMASLAEAMETIEATVNTQKLLIPKIKELYDNQNIQSILNEVEENEAV